MSHQVFVAVLLKVGGRFVTATAGTETSLLLSAVTRSKFSDFRHENMSAGIWCVRLHHVQQNFQLIGYIGLAENLSRTA